MRSNMPALVLTVSYSLQIIAFASFATCFPLIYYRRKHSFSGLTRIPANPRFWSSMLIQYLEMIHHCRQQIQTNRPSTKPLLILSWYRRDLCWSTLLVCNIYAHGSSLICRGGILVVFSLSCYIRLWSHRMQSIIGACVFKLSMAQQLRHLVAGL